MNRDKYELSKSLRYFYEQYNSIRVEPELVGENGIGLPHLISKMYRTCHRFGTFSSRRLHGWERKRTSQYSIPHRERKAIRLFENAMPHTKRYNLHNVEALTAQDVYQADRATIQRYSKHKFVNFPLARPKILADIMVQIKRKLSLSEKRVLSFHEALDLLPKHTSSCYPLFQKKNSKESIKDAQIKINKMIRDPENALEVLNSQLISVFHRFTTRLERAAGGVERKTKIRQVFGVPFPVVILEAMLFGDALKDLSKPKMNGYFSYSLTRVQIARQVESMKLTAIRRRQAILCGDYSKMDSSIPPILIFWVYSFLASHYTYNDTEKEVFLSYLIWNLFSPVMWNAFSTAWMKGGNITGGYATSFTNSFITLLVLSYSYRVIYGRELEPDSVKILGDDFIILLDNASDKEKFIKVFKLFNLTLNATKSFIAEPFQDVGYLGFLWDKNNEPYNDELWYIARICFPERFMYLPGSERIIQRAASILYQVKDGHHIFENVFVSRIPEFNALLKRGVDPLIQYLDRLGSTYSFKIPYSELKRKGWRMF
jgi:hypothetical protein